MRPYQGSPDVGHHMIGSLRCGDIQPGSFGQSLSYLAHGA